MKRVSLILLLATITLSGMAQTIGEAFYIYRNDGQFNAFSRDEVISIEYSYEDADGNTYDEIVTQIVNTADSVYMIPLAAIDSVGFVQPETIINSNVFPLTAEHSPYITNADVLGFTMSTTTPDALLPKVGNIVVSTADCIAFPNGIVARVETISNTGSGYQYSCSQAYYDEVFDQLIVYQPSLDGNASDAAPSFDLRRATLNFTLWDVNWTRIIEGGGTTTTLSVNERANATITIRKTLTTPFYFQLLLQNNITSAIDFNATSTASIQKELQLGKTITAGKIPIHYTMGLLWIEPKLSLFGYFEEQGSVQLNYSGHFNRMDKVEFTFTQGKWNSNHASTTDAGTDVASLSMEGSAEIGLKPQIDFSLNGRQAGFGLSARAGLKEYVNFVFDVTKLSNGGLYDAMRDSYCRTTIPWSVNVHANADIFSRYDAGQSNQGFNYTYRPDNEPRWGEDRYIFPLFENVSASRVSEDKTKADASASVSRTPLLPVQIGFSLLDGKGNILQTKYDGRTYEAGSLFDDYSCEFSSLKASENYFVHPSVKLFGYDILASPNTEIPIGKITVQTLSASNIESNSAILEGKIDGYTMDIDNGEVGFYYSKSGNPSSGNGQSVYVGRLSDLNDGKFFATLSNLQENTSYYYCAYYYDDDIYHYGETKSFTTKNANVLLCPDDNHPHMIDLGLPSGTKWACCNVGANAPEEYGDYYAWGETIKKDEYNESTYNYYQNGSYTDIGTDIAGSIYDAAAINWGHFWAMPTWEQCWELGKECTQRWITQNGVNGCLYIGPSSKVIFFPAAGCCLDNKINGISTIGYYWSSTLLESAPKYAAELNFWGLGMGRWDFYQYRYQGQSIRPVYVSSKDIY